MKIVLFILVAVTVFCVVLGNMPTILYTEACAETSECQSDSSATCRSECWDNGNGGTECAENWYDATDTWVLCSI